MNVHLIGLGHLGLPLARHLAAQGHEVTVSDTSAARQNLAAQAGLRVADTTEALPESQVVVTCLSDDAALRAVSWNLARQASPGTLWLDTSTVSPEGSAAVAERLAQARLPYLRCALSGTRAMADAGRLTVLASGPQSAFERARPLLRAWGPNAFYLGNADQARWMKLVLGLMQAHTLAMLAEGLALGQTGGLAWEDMCDVLASSTVASPLVQARLPALRGHDFSPVFSVAQAQKDLAQALAAAQASGVATPHAALVAQALQAAADAGWEAEDQTAIVKLAAKGG